jgi:hypothetical protein
VIKAQCSNASIEDDLPWKTTSKYWKWNTSATTYWIILKFETEAEMTNLQWKTTTDGRRYPMEKDLRLKTTSDGRHLPMEGNLQWKTIFSGRKPPMEGDL